MTSDTFDHVGAANSLKIDLGIDLEETLDNILENN